MLKPLGSLSLALTCATIAQAQVDISIAVRETNLAGTPPAIGSNGGSAGGIEWINRDGQTLQLNGEWQTFTFDFTTDPVLGFAGATANSILEGASGVLEHIRILNSGGVTGPLNIWIDEVTNTTPMGATVFGDFEGFDDGVEAMFQEPNFSGSTAANLVLGGTSGVDSSVSISGNASYKTRFEFVDATPTRWLRLTTFNATNQLNPAIEFTGSTLSFRMRGVRGTPGTFVRSGAGCPTPALTIGSEGTANVGAPFTITCTNLPVETIATALLMGTATQTTPLDLAGAPGCSLLVDQIFASPTMSFTAPDASVQINIGCDPGAVGNVVQVQTAALAPGVNALGAVLSDRAALRIGASHNPGSPDCATAVSITDGLVSGDNYCATAGLTGLSCGSIGNVVWYQYVAAADGALTLSMCPTEGGSADFDTKIAIFSGSCGSLTEEDCNDDACGFSSQLSTPVSNGTTYFIAVGGFSSNKGNYTMSVANAPIVIPSNDTCATATPIIEGTFSGTTANATTETPAASCASVGSDVWFAYTASCTGTATVSLCSTEGGAANFDTVLAVFDGSCGSLTQIACNDDTCSLQSSTSFATVTGVTYLIALSGFNGAQGSYTLAVSCQ